MRKSENLKEFYNRIHYSAREQLNISKPHINVFERSCCMGTLPYSRRDYYKVTLVIGEGQLEYADKNIHIERPVLMFSNPMIPYTWQSLSDKQSGWFCIFNESFIKQRDEILSELPAFQLGHEKVYYPDEIAVQEISDLFKKMMKENESSYDYKQDILRNYLHLIIHYVLKTAPATNYEKPLDSSARITKLFLELLERQFPIDSPLYQLRMKSANDYATYLSIHPNHLNRALKQQTGKTTTEHISNRILIEANELLVHTDWTIADIAYGLGFEYPAYFNNFYKKQTGITPRQARIKIV